MKVLFVSSGNNKFGISPIIKSQGISLEKEGIEVDYFTINGKGLTGYLKSIPRLRKYVGKNNFDLIHAHYSLSGLVASFIFNTPVIVSLMGSDTQMSVLYRFLIRVVYRLRWRQVIVKSESMKKKIKIKNARVIPNGVNFDLFKPMPRIELRKKLELTEHKKYVLFLADPNRYAKNFQLAQQAFNFLGYANAELKVAFDLPHDEIPEYLNAYDVLLLTSRWEGSPNVIKESMACNLPIVATDVGDICDVIHSTEGCYVSSDKIEQIAQYLNKALDLNIRTNGRSVISYLDSRVIARRLVDFYKETLLLDE